MAAKAAQPDLSEFLNLSKPRRLRCRIAVTLEGLGKEDAELLRAALACDTITHTAISKWLAARELKVSDTVIGHHRRGACSCD